MAQPTPTDAPPSPISVAVCALTLHRPEGLANLLAGLGRIHPPPATDVRIVIVDNDPEGSASTVVEVWRSRLPWPVTYEVESRRGIPAGRNTAIRAAGEVDFVAFIDDDEVPDPDWLVELVAMQRRTDADVVTGPVLPAFDVSPPAWVEAGGFFDRDRFEDGEDLTWATTSSVLIATRSLPATVPPFNEAMALTGGSDTHFFMRANLAGQRMVWADRAVVTETIPATRVTLRWLLTRQYRRGNTLTYCMLDLRDSPARRVRRAVGGLSRIAQGLLVALTGLVRGRAHVVRGLQLVWFGVGLLVGLAGRNYEEYRTIHGR